MSLRDYVLKGDPRDYWKGIVDRSLRELTPTATTNDNSRVTVYFKDLQKELVSKIQAYPVVVGCVAWLRNAVICKALATRQHASFVIQKGDFLRPDVPDLRDHRDPDNLDENLALLKGRYQKLYGNIGRNNWQRFQFPEPLRSMSYLCDDSPMDGVRCSGEKRGHFGPLMHHKFAVFCEGGQEVEDSFVRDVPVPRAVWTGSYNWSSNAENSFENALFIESDEIASLYLNEWALITSISEPLDWNHKYVQPEWRVGS